MDIYTLFVSYGLLCIAAGVALTFVAASMPLASKLWVAALFPTGFAALITSHRHLLGHDIGYTFATSVQFLAAVLMGVGLLAFENRQRKWPEFNVAITAAVVIHLLLSLFLSRVADLTYQALFVTTSYVVTAFWGGVIAGRIARSTAFRSATVLQWVFYLVGFFWMLRYWVLLGGEGGDAFDPVVMNMVIFTGQFLFGIMRWFSYAAMESERVFQRTMENAARIRQQAEELAERNSLMASAMLAVPAACVVTDRNLRVIYLNVEAKRLFGAAGDEMIGREMTRAFVALDTGLEDGLAHLLFLKPYLSGQSRLLEVRSQSFEGDARSLQRVFVVRELRPDPADAAQVVSETRIAPGRVLIASDLMGEVKAMASKLDGMGPSVQESMLDMQNVWRTLESLSPGDVSLSRAKARVLSRATASAMLRANDGMVYHASFSLMLTTDPDLPMLLTEIRIARSGLRQAARGLLGNRPTPEPAASSDGLPHVPHDDIPPFIRRS
jgi:PAS domain-containing protein